MTRLTKSEINEGHIIAQGNPYRDDIDTVRPRGIVGTVRSESPAMTSVGPSFDFWNLPAKSLSGVTMASLAANGSSFGVFGFSSDSRDPWRAITVVFTSESKSQMHILRHQENALSYQLSTERSLAFESQITA